ncbi:interleukin-27 subunit beta isoform X1 [Oryzias latipes]|uniref:Epstein-Barr virus induced 3 n=1 Tax=Oryzias latipes TaxID=8090 RepID=A0A3B3HRM6_ORYLA|nr:interleukin-27 subunit beta isoform X1 [Oryzias latipes]
MFGSAFVTVALLIFVPGSRALDLLRATATSGDPPSIPKVHCRCASYPNGTFCSWPQPAVSSPTHYIATYRERHRQSSTKICNITSSGSSTPSPDSEQQWHCHLPNLKLLTDYIINITAVHSGGSSSYLAGFMLEDIVKPDPPVDVRVSAHKSRNLLVEWSPPPTWASHHIFPLKYQILYRWENQGSSFSVNLGPTDNTKIELKGLIPGRAYQFQVCAKELLGLGHCSSWSSPVNVIIPRKKT